MGETNQQQAGIMRGVLEIVTNFYPDTKIAILIFDPQRTRSGFRPMRLGRTSRGSCGRGRIGSMPRAAISRRSSESARPALAGLLWTDPIKRPADERGTV